MLPKLTDTTQTISFSDGDGMCSAEVFSSDVVVTTNAGNHNHGSSKVKLKNLVDYNWEPKYYPGQLLAVHISKKYLAYAIKAPNAVNPGSWVGMVRVVYSPEPGSDRRALIKGMKGEVHDLSFAHIQNQVVLAIIDEMGNFFVHEIEVTDSGLRCTLIAEILEDTGAGGAWHRTVWCPYIPDEEDSPEDDVARFLLTTHGSVARMWNMRSIASSLPRTGAAGAGGAGSARQLIASAAGVVCAQEHCGAVVDAAFSPDGTALATASADGHVMFFQVFMNNESSPRCLHKWQPHGGKPLSCLFFLDNHKNYNSDVQFWKFAVTGADNNTVLKIWSCKSWSCMQTISFTPAPGTEPGTLGLKAMLDTSAGYLLLSDFKSRSLYVLNMARDSDDSAAYCKSISEFLLPYPVLSFCIVDADEEPVKCESSCDEPYHRSGSSGDRNTSPDEFDVENQVDCEPEVATDSRQVRVQLYIVQPKGLQEGELIYSPPSLAQTDITHAISDLTLEDNLDLPEPAPAAIASSILQQQSQQLKNLLMRSQTQPGSLIGQRAESPPIPQLNLMTPDAFSSPGKREEEDPPLSATPDVTGIPRTSQGIHPEEVSADDTKLTSGGSSPSREVQEIMSHDQPYYKEEMETEAQPTAVTELPAAGPVQNGTDVFSKAEMYASPDKPPPLPAKLTHSNSDTSWPQISLAQITEANQRKASSDKSSNQSLNNTLVTGYVEKDTEAAIDRNRLEQLESKLDKLTELVTSQNRSLSALRSSLTSEALLPRAALDEHTRRTRDTIHTAMHDNWERLSRMGEAASSRAATAAGLGASRALEPLAAALQHELAAKLSATDHLLRDNIDKLTNSKSIMDRLSTAIAKSLTDMVKESFRSALLENVVPVVEKAHAQMYRQLNQAFQNGVKELTANTECAARLAAERGGASASQALVEALERHSAALQAAPTPQVAHSVQHVVSTVLEKELQWWRSEARNVVTQMSRAHTPTTPASSQLSAVDRQMQLAQIQSLINSGDANGAFQLALSAADLSLVVRCCRLVEPQRVFTTPCQLRQHVLLSLVQQLSADMTTDTQLKHRYLEEAIMNLDTTNAVTREHLPTVIRELQKQIVSFLNSNPGHTLTRQFKMLLMATEALVKGV